MTPETKQPPFLYPLSTRTFQWFSFSTATDGLGMGGANPGYKPLSAEEGKRWHNGPPEECCDLDSQINDWVKQSGAWIVNVSAPAYYKGWANNEQTVMATVIVVVVVFYQPPVEAKSDVRPARPPFVVERVESPGPTVVGAVDVVGRPTTGRIFAGDIQRGGTTSPQRRLQSAPARDPFSAE